MNLEWEKDARSVLVCVFLKHASEHYTDLVWQSEKDVTESTHANLREDWFVESHAIVAAMQKQNYPLTDNENVY